MESDVGEEEDEQLHEDDIASGESRRVGGLVGETLGAAALVMQGLLSHIGSSSSSSSSVARDREQEKEREKDAQAVLEAAWRSQFVRCLVEGARGSGAQLGLRAVSGLVNVLAELVLTSGRFVQQFSEAEGLRALAELPHNIFAPRPCPCPVPLSSSPAEGAAAAWERAREDAPWASVLVSALHLVSHLARQGHWQPPPTQASSSSVAQQKSSLARGGMDSLEAALPPIRFAAVLLAAGPTARVKACNLIGNLCRFATHKYLIN